MKGQILTFVAGLLDHQWSDWRNADMIDDYVKPFVQATL